MWQYSISVSKKDPSKKWMATEKITHWNDLNLHLDMFVYPFPVSTSWKLSLPSPSRDPKKKAKHPHLRQQSRSRPKPKVWPKRRPRKASCHGVLSRSFLSLSLCAALKIKIMKVLENTSFLEDAFLHLFTVPRFPRIRGLGLIKYITWSFKNGNSVCASRMDSWIHVCGKYKHMYIYIYITWCH